MPEPAPQYYADAELTIRSPSGSALAVARDWGAAQVIVLALNYASGALAAAFPQVPDA